MFDLLQGAPYMAFNGASSLQLSSNGPSLTSQFSLEFTFTQAVGTAGYLAAHTNALGQRYFGLYSASGAVFFF